VKLSAVTTVARDFLAMGLGTFVILHQELGGRSDPTAWTVGAALILGPAGWGALTLLRGNPKREDTTGPSSQPAERSSLS
jgi:hypothetical protein